MKLAPAKRLLLSRMVCALLSASLAGRSVHAALPPSSSGAAATSAPSASGSGLSLPASVAGEVKDEDEDGWQFPPIRLGGSLGFDWRHESGEGRKVLQRGAIGTFSAATDTYIWEPWFARLGGKVSLSTTRNSLSSSEANVANHNVSQTFGVSGNANLRVLPGSRFPFNGYWSRNDNRFSSELLSTGSYVGQRIGFEQVFGRTGGDLAVAFDRSTQESDNAGKTSQDTLQLRISETLDLHRINANASLSRNKHVRSDEHSNQRHLTVQHNYTPATNLSLDSMVNLSQSDFQLTGATAGSQLVQVSSTLFWRPEDQPLTVSAGARVLGASSEARNLETGSATEGELRNANVNLGVQYELNRNTRLTAATNLNTTDSNGNRMTTTGTTGSIHYAPDARKIGNFDYGWNAGANASFQGGGEFGGSQLTLQLSHRLSRSFELGESEAITIEGTQGLAVTNSTILRVDEPRLTRYLTHGGALSWNKNADGHYSVVRLSVSDYRALDGRGDTFQMFNLQASSNLPTGAHTSWSGSLTLQGTRQGSRDAAAGSGLVFGRASTGFTVTSTGSLTYRNQRAFGVRGLRYTSDLRLNSEALLPLLGGPQDQELSAWENRLDYSIGRLNLRFATLWSQVKAPVPGLAPNTLVRENRVHRSVMFSVMRSFGD